MGNFVSQEKLEAITRAMIVGTPQRKASYSHRVDRKTIARHARRLGRAAMLLNAAEEPQPWRRIQVDEFYTHILAKKRNVPDIKSEVEVAGEALHFLAVDVDSGYIIHHLVAPTNNRRQCSRFLQGLDKKLTRENDQYKLKPTIISDGHGSYESVITESYPDWNYAKVKKHRTLVIKDGDKVIKKVTGGWRRVVVQGSIPDPDNFANNYVEGVNSAARDQNARVMSESKAFSKRFQQHIEQFDLWVHAHNHLLENTRTKQTPAMKAGVDKTTRDECTFLKQVEMLGSRLDDPSLFDESYRAFGRTPQSKTPSGPLFYVYHSLVQKSSRVHTPNCRFCKHGAGLSGQPGVSGIWTPFATYQEAVEYAERYTPGRVFDCKECIGERAPTRHGRGL